MARNNKNLASFGDVASINNNNTNNNINNDVNNNNNINVNNGVEDVDNADGSLLDSILKGKKKKSNDAILTGIYLKKPLADILNQLGKKGGKGAKSRIVNELLEKAFKEKGLL